MANIMMSGHRMSCRIIKADGSKERIYQKRLGTTDFAGVGGGKEKSIAEGRTQLGGGDYEPGSRY